jgi:hypothetical protein
MKLYQLSYGDKFRLKADGPDGPVYTLDKGDGMWMNVSAPKTTGKMYIGEEVVPANDIERTGG